LSGEALFMQAEVLNVSLHAVKAGKGLIAAKVAAGFDR